MPDTAALVRFCGDHGVGMAVTNHGVHYQFSRDNKVVDWWPTTGKYVVDKKWRKADNVQRTGKIIKRLALVFPVVASVAVEEEPAYLTRLRELDALP